MTYQWNDPIYTYLHVNKSTYVYTFFYLGMPVAASPLDPHFYRYLQNMRS